MLAFVAAAPAAQAQLLGQKLVTSAQASHSDVTEMGILLPQSSGCTVIASTDVSDRGQKCESADLRPLKTGNPAVSKESDGYDVAVLLHDANGHRVGVLTMEMKLAGHTRASAEKEARQIEGAMAKQIPNRAALTR